MPIMKGEGIPEDISIKIDWALRSKLKLLPSSSFKDMEMDFFLTSKLITLFVYLRFE